MKTEIVERHNTTPVDLDLSGASTEDLRRELADAIGVTARTVARLALIWGELERRGEDLSALRGGGLFVYLPAIAAGTLDPEVVVRCAGQVTVIRAMTALPIQTQRRLLDEGVPIATIDGDGTIRETVRPVETLTMADVRVGIAGGELRPVAAQIALLAPARRRQPVQRGVIVKVRLTQAQYDSLRSEAARRGQHTPTLARELLLAAISGEQ